MSLTKQLLTRVGLVLALVSLLSIAPLFASAQEDVDDGPAEVIVVSNPTGSTACFTDERYRFGSVSADPQLDLNGTVAGQPLSFNIVMENENPYPIADAGVFVKIFRVRDDEVGVQQNGHDVVDQYFVKEHISLGAGESVTFPATWDVPQNARSGQYRIVTYVGTVQRYNLLGLPFTDDVGGNQTEFTISGIDEGVQWNKDGVTVNGGQYLFAGFTPKVDPVEPVLVETSLVNDTEKQQVVTVNWKLYYWDAQREEQLIEEKQEGIVVDAGATVNPTFEITDTEYSVYYLVADAKWRDSHSIIGVRFTREGVDMPRINFPSMGSYPLVAGEEVELFSCVHNAGTNAVVEGNELTLTLKDFDDSVIHSYTYTGDITGAMMAVADTFTPEKDYTSFSLTATLRHNGSVVDETTTVYNCADLGAPCPQESTTTATGGELPYTYIAIGIAVLLFLIILVFFMKKRTRSEHLSEAPPTTPTSALMLLVIFIASLFTAIAIPTEVEAKSEVWQTVFSGSLARFNTSGTDTWYQALSNLSISVARNAYVFQNGTQITDGTQVSVDDELTFTAPVVDQDIYWFGTGHQWDSPYGVWFSEGGYPSSQKCDPKYEIGSDVNVVYSSEPSKPPKFYIPLSVNPSNITFTHDGSTAGLNCNAIGDICTVTSAGTIETQVNYSSTYGYFYFNLYDFSDNRCEGYKTALPICTQISHSGITCATVGSTYQLKVPTQIITFTHTAVADNNPPLPPKITEQAENTHETGETQYFDIVSTDPDGDTIRYGIDWNLDNLVDIWIPGSYVPSGTIESFVRSFSPAGSHTFQALAQDSRGASSDWTEYVLSVDDGQSALPPEVLLAANPLIVDAGNPTTLTWVVGNADNGCVATSDPVGYWSGDKDVAGLPEDSNILNTAGTYTFRLTCYNAVWQEAYDEVSVTVMGGSSPEAPTVSLSATSPVNAGGYTTVSWTVDGKGGPALCTPSAGGTTDWSSNNRISGSFSGIKSDSDQLGPINADTTFSLYCENPDGSDTASAYVTVTSGGGGNACTSPGLAAEPPIIRSSETTTLTWENTTDGATCTLTGGGESITSNNTENGGDPCNDGDGNELTVNPSNTTTYTLTCDADPAGNPVTWTDTVTVYVIPTGGEN